MSPFRLLARTAFFSLSLIVAALPAAQARDTFVYMGGVADNPDYEQQRLDEAGFERSFDSFRGFARGSGWESRFYYGGEFARTRMTEQRPRPFNSDAIETEVKTLETALRAGSFRAGERILIVIDTHGQANAGAASPGMEPADTHRVSTASGPASLDPLARLGALAREKGVRLAIADLSCYSGRTLQLESSGACVIAAARPTQLGWSDFSNQFARRLSSAGSGDTAESLYLAARAATQAGAPQISTNAGREASARLEVLQSYITGVETRLNMSRPNCPAAPATLRRPDQTFDEAFARLGIRPSWRLGGMGGGASTSAATAAELRQKLDEYDAVRARLDVAIPPMGEAECVGERCPSTSTSAANFVKIEEDRIAYYEARRRERRGTLGPLDSERLQTHRQQREQFLAIGQRLRALEQRRARGLPRATEDFAALDRLAGEIATIERRLYSAEYAVLTAPPPPDDPCRAFNFRR